MKEFTKEEKLKVMVRAKNILLSGNCKCMCGCIDKSLEYLSGIVINDYFYFQILFPEFNKELAIKKFGARPYSYSYWWNIDDNSRRIEYFDYLIKLYSE